MKKICLLISLYLIVLGCSIFGSPQLIKQTEKLYNEGNFTQAIKNYKLLQNKGYTNPELNYNIANCYLKNNELGKAICVYRRAQRSLIRDKDIRTNLAIAQKKLLDETKKQNSNFIGSLTNVFKLLSTNELFGIIVVLLMILNIILIYEKLTIKKEITKNIRYVMIILLIVFGSVAYFNIQYINNQNSGVIIAKKVHVKEGPSNSDTISTRFYVHEGMEFTILESNTQWSKIKLKNGFIGWIENHTFWKI